MEGSWNTNGGQPPACDNRPQPTAHGGKLPMPTVHDALPFTPLPSIIPFSPDMIHPPTAAPVVQPSAFSNYADVNKSKAVLDQLSAGATRAETASKRCQQSIRDVQRLLDPSSLTPLSFKKPAKINNSTAATPKPNKDPSTTLSPFAKMVLDNTSTTFSYLTPEHSPEPQAVTNGHGVKSMVTAPLATPQSLAKPTEMLADPSNSQTTGLPSSQHRQVSAVMPKVLSEAQRAQYQHMPDQDAGIGAQHLMPSKPPPASAHRSMNLAQREKKDLALTKLQNLMSDLFQKEDQMQPGTSEEVSVDAAAIFELRDTPDGSKLSLRANAQSTLESAISAVVSSDRLGEVDVDELQRAQSLCEAPVASIESLEFSIDDGWSEQEVSEWAQRIHAATHGLSAGRTLTQIMAGCAHLKELQSEGYLSQAIDALSIVSERCVIPLAEVRPTIGERSRGDKNMPPPNPAFVIASDHRQDLHVLLNAAVRAMRSLGKLLGSVEVDESVISKLELLCTSIIFAENATSEKESAIGPQIFETLRHVTMDLYANLFTKYPHQRASILKSSLGQLEKLPATKQSARQYRLAGTKPIQLVSALLMRLVQTSATRTTDNVTRRSVDDESAETDDESDSASQSESEDTQTARKRKGRGSSLLALVQPLRDAAHANAQFVAAKLLERAVNTSKSSEEPYRRLLDIFTEDFLNVLGSSDWPAAELLLRALVTQMVGLVENPKQPAPARTLALELLGVIGSGIIELQMNARQAEQSIDETDEVANHMKALVQQGETGNMDTRDLVALDGPYRIWAEYLNEKGADEDALLQSAHGYMLMDWAYVAATGREASADIGSGDGASGDLHAKLREMLLDPKWLDEHSTLRVGTSMGRLAVLLATLNSTLCRLFPKILNLLLTSLSSEQSSVRSRGLRSMNTLLDKDASLLDRHSSIVGHINRCLQDKSALVRDSALNLLQKCVSLKFQIHSRLYAKIAERTKDANTSVRKRAIKMLKDIYVEPSVSPAVRSAIVDAVLLRLEDTEESVVELARTTMEEVWFHPFYGKTLSGDNAASARRALYAHIALVIATADREDKLLPLLEGLIKLFTTKAKFDTANLRVCRTMISILFDGIIDNTEIPGSPPQSAILRSLTIFAKATPTLFSASQLERVEPYTENIKQTDSSEVFRYVVTILRHVMPHLQMSLSKDFVQKLQSSLLRSCTAVGKPELREVAPCLWTINGILGNVDRLVNFLVSVIVRIREEPKAELVQGKGAARVSKLMIIASEFGNACDFEGHLAKFKAKCEWYKGDSVPGLIVDTLCGFTNSKALSGIRQIAIDGICTVALAWPKQFLRTEVIKALEMAFKDRVPEIEIVLLSGLESFFVAQEVPEETAEGDELPKGIASGTERLGRTYVASDTDGASTSLAQRFLAEIQRIALASYTEPAFIAARLVVSVNKQGLVHPKDSGPVLVALETCPNKSVASAAFKEHKAQHQKHETVFEKEYMRAVQRTFDYQNEVIGDAFGFVAGEIPTAKMNLTYEVLKTGKAQVRKKFLGNISQKMNFDMAKLNLSRHVPEQLALVRFCCENLALFDYDKVEDLLHLLTSMEKIFSSTGSAVAQAVESEVLKMQVDGMLGSEGVVNGAVDAAMTVPSRGDIDPARLRQLCVSAQILSIIWETRSFLRRVWNMHKYMAKAKGKDKDASKTPNRGTNASKEIETYLKRVREIIGSASSESEQRAMCSAFVELISVDSEVKVNSDNEDNVDMDVLAAGYDTPSEGSSRKSPSVGASGGGRGRKRKASVSGSNTPRKRGRPKKTESFNKAADGDEEGGWD